MPGELRRRLELEEVQHLPLDRIMVPGHRHREGFGRAQAEVVAGRVSALNECFFRTSGHARLLRESGRAAGLDVDLDALVDPAQDIGVPAGAGLLAFAEAAIGPDRRALDRARAALAEAAGPRAVPAAAAVAANFSKNDRIANGCGIPMDPMVLEATKDIRARLRLDDYRSAANTFKHFPEERASR